MAAAFDRAIPPGGEGRVIIRVQTAGYEGRRRWGAKVWTNDPNWKIVILEVQAFVKPIISVSPKRLQLDGKKGTVQIKTTSKRPLTLEVVTFSLQNELTYRLREMERGKAFEITFTPIPNQKNGFRGFLRLKTNYPERPYVTVNISG